jgi:5-methylcytosine-specific restriction endonuclease McrA
MAGGEGIGGEGIPVDDWKRVHGELTRLARIRAGHDAEEARWLMEGKRFRIHARLGCATYLEYLERVLGYPPRQAREKLRVAEALVDVPLIRDALAAGDLTWSAVREVTRVAVPETCAEWLAAARGRTVREVEELVSGRRPGDRPGDPPDPAARRHVLRLEITGETLAAFRDARRCLEDASGHALEDDELVRLLAHHALGGPADPGRASYQIAMTVCEACGAASRDGGGRAHPVDSARLEAARCDAQVVSATHAGAPLVAASQTIPPRIRRAVWRRDHGRCQVPGCRGARFLEVHHIVPRSRGGTHDLANLVVLCSAHHGRVHDGSLRLGGRAPDRIVVEWQDTLRREERGGEAGRAGREPAGPLDPVVARRGGDPRGSAERDARARVGSIDPGAATGASHPRGSVGQTAPDPGGRGVDPERSPVTDATGALRRPGIDAIHARIAVQEALEARPLRSDDLLRAALSILYARLHVDRFRRPRDTSRLAGST